MSGESFTVHLPPGTGRGRFWFWDPSHFPQPVSTAAEHVDLPAMAAGFQAAAAELRRPLAGQYVRVERGYVYFGIDVPESAADLARRRDASAKVLDGRVDTALARWMEQYAPEAERLNAAINALADPSLGDAALAEGLDEAIALRSRQWAVHDLALVPAMEAAARFTARYGALLGGEAGAQRLLQGFPNRATAVAEALDALAEAARERRALSASLLDGDAAASRSIRVLPQAAWLREHLDAFLGEYGDRVEAWDVAAPPWREDPRPLLEALRARLRRPAAEPGARRREAAAERERAVVAALAALPPEERPSFLIALHAAQAYPVVSEDHNALIDQAGLVALRRVLLEAGGRLHAAGRLMRVEDALWLTRAELQGALRGMAPPLRRAAVRRAWQRRRSRLVPPRSFGRALPAWAAADATLAHFFGLGGEPGGAAAAVRGVGVSAGVVRGRACVVRTLDDAGLIEDGDILVCPMTSPAWTPWLSLIAGAVVETGGLLSHTAVLAREYGIPCVVAARDATALIPHGATVFLDGGSGEVWWTGASPSERSPAPRVCG